MKTVLQNHSHFYRPKRSFGQGNIFTAVCHSFCSHGGGVSGPNFRRGGLLQFFGGRGWWCLLQFFGGGVCSNFRNTVNIRPVRILLECILLVLCLQFMYIYIKRSPVFYGRLPRKLNRPHRAGNLHFLDGLASEEMYWPLRQPVSIRRE